MTGSIEFFSGTMDDLVEIFGLIDLTGWGERIEDIRSVIRNPDNHYITAIDMESNQMIGIILAVRNGEFGFIAHVIVRPEYRKMGIGQELMNEGMAYLKDNGCLTVKLDAVPNAKTLYERVEFKPELKSIRLLLDISSDALFDTYQKNREKLGKKIQVFNTKECDLSQIIESDLEIFGADRRNLLMTLFELYPDYAFLSRDKNDNLTGYLFGLYKNGCLTLKAGVCDSKETCASLIDSAIISVKEKERVQSIYLGTVENSKFGLEVLDTLGFKQTKYSLRMYFGKKAETANNPAIFAIGDPAKG
ncbi:MAG: GNAT family N-acetyltransferase [Candidatus Heimdallarchaeota archaeon]